MSDIRIRKLRNALRKKLNVVEISVKKPMSKVNSRNYNSFFPEKSGLQSTVASSLRPNDYILSTSSIFNNSPAKPRGQKESVSLNSTVKSKNSSSQLKKTRTRMESLDSLLQQCNDIKENSSSKVNIHKHSKKALDSIKRIKRSIENCQEKNIQLINSETSEKIMRADASLLRQQLGIVTERFKTPKKVWKFVTPSITKKTEQLILSVEQELASLKPLHK